MRRLGWFANVSLLIPPRPTPVFFMPARAMLAAVIEQSLPDFLPCRMWPVDAHSVGVTDLNSATAAEAVDAQHRPRNLG